MRVLVTGASGQLGYDVCKSLSDRNIEYRGISSKELNITNASAVLDYFEAYHPDAVIHCAAYTAVDKAENESEKCFAVNATGTRNVAIGCREIGAKMLYISTDYVFPGDGCCAYETSDPTGPKNVYGASKLAGENAVRETLAEHFIVRISWVFGVNGKNFVKTMLHLSETHSEISVVEDQIGSPTYTADLAPLLCDLIATEQYGDYHATNEGFCSWAEFAQEIFYQAGRATRVIPIPTSKYPTAAVRPLNSRLSKMSLNRGGFDRLPNWRPALGRYLKEISETKET